MLALIYEQYSRITGSGKVEATQALIRNQHIDLGKRPSLPKLPVSCVSITCCYVVLANMIGESVHLAHRFIANNCSWRLRMHFGVSDRSGNACPRVPLNLASPLHRLCH